MAIMSILLLLFAVCVQQLLAVDTVVDLGHAQYRGQDQGDGVTSWVGMRYARSVSRIDGMRFAPPQDPLPARGIVNATKFAPLCIGTNSNLQYEFGEKWSEDCLFANVFAPTNATIESALPVYVFIQGGGFNLNGNANYNGTDLIEAADGQMVVVNFNYRVGPYGFLASKEVAENKTLSLNNGLLDQRQLLKWVQKNIRQFGGDPNHVTLGGASAGAGSVVLHLTAYGGRDDKLFHAAAAESPAFPPLRNTTETQWAYDALLKSTGCKDLLCMQNMDAVQFQSAVRSLKVPYPGAKGLPIFFWNPTLDYDFVRDYTYNEIKAGHFVKVPTIFGDDTNEGLVFTPKTVTSLNRAQQFITDQFPNLDNQERDMIRDVWQGPRDTDSDPRWQNLASDVYGHIRYTCPGLNISSAYADDGSAPTYQYRWNVGTALHVSEIMPVWHGGTSAPAAFIHKYWASFIRTYDPNTFKREFRLPDGKNISSPAWDTFGEANGNRMFFSNNNEVNMEEVSNEQWERCDVISELGTQLDQ
ncbi:Alpha/Beta hydrolase protein [Massariosphaeria phaeospora]|uniref:Carboxylic ester hydrolase n=1 Tax=Massariosphaeria phaeospora TaxID=100035 RepID=A0A7C8M2N5_9PLEO|nr:Alpha/Beta hydrolase protein [Massariosphaeria phaeospora]